MPMSRWSANRDSVRIVMFTSPSSIFCKCFDRKHDKLERAPEGEMNRSRGAPLHGLGGDSISVGSALDNDVVLAGDGVARYHATLHKRDGQVWFVDRSWGPSAANGAPIQPGHEVPFDFRTEFTVGDVPVPLAHPSIIMMLLQPGQVVAAPGQVILGREPARASWVLAHASVSGLHATLTVDRVMVQDHGSTSGTWVFGQRIPPHHATPYDPNGLISFGPVLVPASLLARLAQSAQLREADTRAAVQVPRAAAPVHSSHDVAATRGTIVSAGPVIGECSLDQFADAAITIGRGDDNQVVVPHAQVSSHHAEIRKRGRSLFLVDRSSVNGTFVHGRRLASGEIAPVEVGDTVHVGPVPLRLRVTGDQVSVVVDDARDRSTLVAKEEAHAQLGGPPAAPAAPRAPGTASPDVSEKLQSAAAAPLAGLAANRCRCCDNELRSDWKLCPHCGTPPSPICACGENLVASWKLCPFCGAAVGTAGPVRTPLQDAARPTTRADVDLVASWRLRALFDEVWMTSCRDVFAGIRDADGLSPVLSAREPARLVGACGMGLVGIARLEAEPGLPLGFRRAAPVAGARKVEFLRSLSDASAALQQATLEVRALKLPEGTAAGVLHGAIQANDPRTEAGAGALGGALLGTFILPGVGTAIGGALGAWVGQNQAEGRSQPILERYDTAAERMLHAVDELFDIVWDALVEAATPEGLTLAQSAHFGRAGIAWSELRPQVLAEVGITSAAPVRARIEAFLAQWGPHQDALHLLVRTSIRPYDLAGPSVRRIAKTQVETYPSEALSHEDAADVELELGDAARALEIADTALQRHVGHTGLVLTRIEALAACGREREANAAEVEARSVDADRAATLYRARGLVRGRKLDAAALVIAEWVKEAKQPFAVTRRVRADALLEELYSKHHLSVPDRLAEMRGIIETHLDGDGGKRFFGLPPPPRDANARVEFLGDLSGDEETLFFFDWSVLGNAKTGFALTTTRIVWKCVWEDPVRIPFTSVTAGGATAEAKMLTVAGRTVDMEDAALAAAVATTILELTALGNRA